MYEVPHQYFYRLHHVRPRFKNDVEDVLLYVAQRISGIQALPESEFQARLFDDLRAYPGNLSKKKKTIDNWRTEISALFGFVLETDGMNSAGEAARQLASSGDLVQFFRNFLLRFQYPGGHVKPTTVLEQLKKGIHFHPASFIIRIFEAGDNLVGPEKSFSLSAAELTHVVFNDLRCTSSAEFGPEDAARIILRNRQASTIYDETGDVIRYALDILDYLVLAEILYKMPTNGRYYFDDKNRYAANQLVARAALFSGYDQILTTSPTALAEIAEIESDWFEFANLDLGPLNEELETLELSAVAAERGLSIDDLIDGIRRALEGGARDIGWAGEALAIDYEQRRLTGAGLPELAKKVCKIPDQQGVGYDILSFEGKPNIEDVKRHIEVKTTRSYQPLKTFSFRLTNNEWGSAKALKDSYYVFRVMVSHERVRTIVLRNPWGMYEAEKITVRAQDGWVVTFDEEQGEWIEIFEAGDHGKL